VVRYSTVQVARGRLTGGGPRPQQEQAIFVAYSFDRQESETFRQELESRLRNTTSMRRVKVRDGHVAEGRPWASSIRKRLQSAHLLVADLTVVEPEVLCECGFAWGLGCPIVPVISATRAMRSLPEWIRDLQIGSYGTEAAWDALIDSIAEHLNARNPSREPVPSPVPNQVLLLRANGGTPPVADQLQAAASRYGLDCQEADVQSASLDEDNLDVLWQVASSSAVVAPLTGTQNDNFAFFSVGMVLARPTAGEARSKLYRRIILHCTVPSVESTLTTTFRRNHRSIRVTSASTILQELHEFGRRFDNWRMGQEKP